VTLDGAELRSRIESVFQENFSRFGDLGAAVSIWQDGESVLELHGGFRDKQHEQVWTEDTLVLVWSATKGIGSACLLHALQETGIELSRKVADLWPEFGQNNKSDITIGTLMSHRAGLCAIDKPVDILDYAAVMAALEQQTPLWEPATAHGYHARTFGFLIDELHRRITGSSIAEYWRKTFAEPLDLDFWIGLPNELNPRVATMYPAKAGSVAEPMQFYRDLATPGTLQRKVFTSPHGLNSVSAMNKPEIRAIPIVSLGGIGTATALAKFYALLANDGVMDGRRFFASQTIRRMTERRADGPDLVFEIPTAFSAGFMMDSAAAAERRIFGETKSAFGHPGAGGSHAFADSENRIGFAYVMNQMEQSVLPTAKSVRLIGSLYAR
jgi:CubicO group peptidase (beta-lactamase class C family)